MPSLLRTLLLCAALAAPAAAAAQEADHHAGYYYPEPQSVETYTARVDTLPASDRLHRIVFATGVTQQLLKGRYAPPFAVFAKGDDADKLIIVALQDGPLDTLYRARAALANLTAMARVTAFFREHTTPENATFFDLLKLLGFKQLTVSDGVRFAHQVLIE
ncbi:MAG: molybdopterin-guanine dinucleotide biosynthesis protein A [Rhodospirillaceae bacterium]|nr:molybdopterin-guanine dinucleotide biosynthesis protein A [Rhodospirillaceae bacterium]